MFSMYSNKDDYLQNNFAKLITTDFEINFVCIKLYPSNNKKYKLSTVKFF